MNISGIRTYAGFYDYNTIKKQEMRNQQIGEAKADEQNASSELQEQKRQEEVVVEVTPAEPDQGAIEYAKKYQPDATYELKGAQSDIAHLDVEKALSDMSKDKVLQQYQFYVGERKAGDALSEQRMQENFYL